MLTKYKRAAIEGARLLKLTKQSQLTQPFYRMQPIRHFNQLMDQDKSRKEERDEYQSQFDNLLGDKSKKVSKEERAFIDRQEQAKKLADEAQKKIDEELAEKIAAQKAEEFDNLLNGGQKKAKPILSDDKNLQQIFSELYGRAKEVKIERPGKGLFNSAKDSIGSLGSKLEQRRQKLKQAADFDAEIDRKESKPPLQEDQSTQKMESASKKESKDQVQDKKVE